MIYVVIVMRNGSVEQTFADALQGQGPKPRTVYVAGMTEEAALAAAFSDQQVVDMEEPDAETLLRFTFSENVGTESHDTPYEDLLALAKNRADQLTRREGALIRR